ncbi:MAG TPA: hypothetical protein ENI05_04395 [Porticoccus sp.]|nr:hypothetical protein [Porticoccus sp.]
MRTVIKTILITGIRSLLFFVGFLGLTVSSIVYSQTDSDPTAFEKRCGQCHKLDGATELVPLAWLERLGKMGSVVDLSDEEQAEVLSFFQHHNQRAAKVVAMTLERQLFEKKCSLCHSPDRVFIQTMEQEQLQAIVKRMQSRVPDWISDQDASVILRYLLEGAPGGKRLVRKEVEGGPEIVFRKRCSACHTLERVYLYLDSMGQKPPWEAVVKRMQGRAPTWISEKEAQQILGYLRTLKPAP